LPDYVEQKTQGRIPAQTVEVLLGDIRTGKDVTGKVSTLSRLLNLTGNQCAVVDADTQADLDCFAADVLTVVAQGKRFYFAVLPVS